MIGLCASWAGEDKIESSGLARRARRPDIGRPPVQQHVDNDDYDDNHEAARGRLPSETSGCVLSCNLSSSIKSSSFIATTTTTTTTKKTKTKKNKTKTTRTTTNKNMKTSGVPPACVELQNTGLCSSANGRKTILKTIISTDNGAQLLDQLEPQPSAMPSSSRRPILHLGRPLASENIARRPKVPARDRSSSAASSLRARPLLSSSPQNKSPLRCRSPRWMLLLAVSLAVSLAGHLNFAVSALGSNQSSQMIAGANETSLVQPVSGANLSSWPQQEIKVPFVANKHQPVQLQVSGNDNNKNKATETIITTTTATATTTATTTSAKQIHQPRSITTEKQQPIKRSPTSSIFDSLLGSSSSQASSTAPTTLLGGNENLASSEPATEGSELARQQHNQQQQHSHQQSTSGDSNPYFKIGQVSDKVTLPGDILLGGLFPIHMKGTKIECGQINRDRGIQRLEAMLYALDRINEDSLLLPDIKLGAILLDSCSSSTYALNQSLEFIRASINTVESSAFECKDKSTPRPKYGSKMIAGVIGGSYSEVSLQVANLLRLFRIPQVSYASTGTALSDKTLYDLFARTVPSDMFQARAIADIVNRMGWSYVSLVSSEGLYGDSGSKEFIKQASNRRICIAVHEKISPTIGESAYDLIVQSLVKRNATGVVLFTRAEDTRELLMAVKRTKLLHQFAWVAADGWGTHQKLVEGVEDVAWGAITVELQAKAIPGFDQYMKKLTPWGNGRNPWFSEYWQEWFDCQLQANLLQQQRLASGAAYAAARRRSVGSMHGVSGGDSSDAYSNTIDTEEEDEGASSGARARRSAVTIASSRSSSTSTTTTTSIPARPVVIDYASCPKGENLTRCSMTESRTSRQQASSSGDPKSSAQVSAAIRRAKRNSKLAELPQMDEAAARVKQFCSPNLRISESNGYRQEQKVQFVVDAVYAMAHALHKAWSHLCDAKPGVVCEALKELNGGEFYTKYLLNVSFKDLAGSEVKFDEHGDGLGRYNIYNFRQVRPQQSATLNKDMVVPALATLPNDSIAQLEFLGGGSPDAAPIDKFGGVPGSSYQRTTGNGRDPVLVEHIYTSNVEFEYATVGRWTEDDYVLSLKEIQFLRGGHSVPESYCSRPCEVGQAKIMRAGDHCCWICKTCQPYEFLPDEFSCLDCGIGRWPVNNKTSCFDLPQKYLRWDSVFSLISLSVACLGIGLTLFVTIIFVKYIDTPVVKASGRELSFILLAGVAFCHLATFVLLAKPTTFVCGGQRFLVGFGFALMYSSLLVKTNRISRIFNCARKSAKRPSFISPKSQMLITGILVGIQIFLTIIWYFFEPPGVRADSPEGKRDEVILKCRVKGRSFILSLVYNMILITTCTVYAVKTRKIPENFNESKFIGFTMYTTIVIWLAFVTMFFGTNNSYEIQMNTMCVCISLSAYVTLFCLFSPKISIILLHPDKNVRKLTMNSATYKRAFKPVSSVASIDGRHNLPPGGSSQPEAPSGGPVSSTSNVLNLDTQGNRLQESSIVSNVVNSNSGGSNCSQKTPTLLSQQLALVGICANCGAHQLTSAPTTTSTSTNAGGVVATASAGQGRHWNGAKSAVMSPALARQMANEASQRWQKPAGTSGGGGSCQQTNESQGFVQVSSSRSVGGGGAVTSKAATILHQKITASGPQHQQQHHQQQQQQLAGDASASLRRQIKRSPSDELLLTKRNTDGGSSQQHNHSSGMHDNQKQPCHHHQQQQQQQQQNVCSTGQLACLSGHSHDVYQSGSQRRKSSLANGGGGRQHIGSLSRLNEMTSFTSSGDRQCIEESISSLVNDSFMNTSLENTPCNAGHGGAGSHMSSSGNGRGAGVGATSNHCKGSDSMLCNQSVHSIDYCSDCCPSLCQCSCQVCLSQTGAYENGAESLCSHRHNSAGLIRTGLGDDDYSFDGGGGSGGTGQGNYDAMCIVQLVQRTDGQQQQQEENTSGLINDESAMVPGVGGGGHFDTSEASGSTLIRCRKLSIDSSSGPTITNNTNTGSSRQFALSNNNNSTGKQGKSGHASGNKMVTSKSGTEITASSSGAGSTHRHSDGQYEFVSHTAAGSSRLEFSGRMEQEHEGQLSNSAKSARRSQTMEMRTIVVGDDGDDSPLGTSGLQQQHQPRHQYRGKSRQDYRHTGQAHSSNYDSGDSLDSNNQLGEQRQPSRGQPQVSANTAATSSSKTSRKKLTAAAASSATTAASAGYGQLVAYALQSAATSALGAAASQIVVARSGAQTADNNNNNSQTPEASSSTFGGTGGGSGGGGGSNAGGGIQSKYGAPNISKLNESSKTSARSAAASAKQRRESFFEKQQQQQQQQQLGEVDNLVVAGIQKQPGQPGANQTLGTIQASLERVKSIEARRKSMEASAAGKHRRKSGCFNYHDDYEYSYGLVQSSDSDDESGGIEDYYYDDDDEDDDVGDDDDEEEDGGDDADDDDGARECYYEDEETYLRLGHHGLGSSTRKTGAAGSGVGVGGVGGEVAGSGATTTTTVTTTTCDHGRQTNELLRGADHIDDDKSGSLGNDDDDDFEHDGRVSLERAGPNRAWRQKQQQQQQQHEHQQQRQQWSSRVTASSNERSRSRGESGSDAISLDTRVASDRHQRHHQRRRRSTKRRNQQSKKRQLELEEHRINSVALITATLRAGGAIVESCGGLEGDKATTTTAGVSQRQPSSGSTAIPVTDSNGQTASTVANTGMQTSGHTNRNLDDSGIGSAFVDSRQTPAEQKSNRELGASGSLSATSNQQQQTEEEDGGASGGGATATYLGSF